MLGKTANEDCLLSKQSKRSSDSDQECAQTKRQKAERTQESNKGGQEAKATQGSIKSFFGKTPVSKRIDSPVSIRAHCNESVDDDRPSPGSGSAGHVLVLEDDVVTIIDEVPPESDSSHAIELDEGGSIVASLAGKLKSHQVEAVQFMWKRVILGIEGKKTNIDGRGCILAHSMGLGKSLSIVTLVHSFTRRQLHMGGKSQILVICPTTVIANWSREFLRWLPRGTEEGADQIRVMVMDKTQKTLGDRANLLRSWQRQATGTGAGPKKGSVLIMGYEMYKGLVSDTKAVAKKYGFVDLLAKSCDLVVLDEGHRVRNASSAVSNTLAMIQTKRRIVLTGTPLQNNLGEYYVMVNFIQPGFLGSKKYFQEMFATPIGTSMMADASKEQVGFGKRRAYILSKKIAPLVQRKDDSVLRAMLPPKEEIVVYTCMSDVQVLLYQKLLEHHTTVCPAATCEDPDTAKCRHLLSAHSYVQRLVNHPDVLREAIRVAAAKKRLAQAEAARKEQVKQRFAAAAAAASNPPADAVSESKGDAMVDTRVDEAVHIVDLDDDTKKADAIKQCMCSEPPQEMRNESGDQEKTDGDGDDGDGEKRDKEMGLGGIDEDDARDLEAAGFEQLGVEWGNDTLLSHDYVKGVVEHGGKMVVLMELLLQCRRAGERCLVFSQSVVMLNCVQAFIDKHNLESTREERITAFRLDGSTPQQERQLLVNKFNNPATAVHTFLISTNAGGVGLNLPGASRVIIVDSSWNPAADAQAAMRAYRIGQTKRVFVYRLIAAGTMEHLVYDRQVSKAQLAKQIVDKTDVTRLFSSRQLNELFKLEKHSPEQGRRPLMTSSSREASREDSILTAVMQGTKCGWILKTTRHEDATEHDDSEQLSREDEEKAEQEEQQIQLTGSAFAPAPSRPALPMPVPHHSTMTSAASAQQETISLRVPDNTFGGMLTQFSFKGKLFQIQLPPGTMPGSIISVRV